MHIFDNFVGNRKVNFITLDHIRLPLILKMIIKSRHYLLTVKETFCKAFLDYCSQSNNPNDALMHSYNLFYISVTS